MAVAEKKKELAQTASTLSKLQEQYTPMLRTLQEDSQNHSILKHLMTRGSINQMEAVENLKCYRLSARIADLRGKGANIETEKVPLKSIHGATYYARYWLKEHIESEV